MAYSQPPQYSFGDSGDSQQYQQPQSPGAPGYSPQPTSPHHQTQPMTQPGMTGPIATGPTPPAGQNRSPLVPVLAIASALCFVGTVLFGILWFQSNGKVEDAESLADDRADTVEELENEVTAAEEQVGELEGQLGELESQTEEVEAMQTCLDDLKTYYATEPESDAETDALDEVYITCTEYIF